MTKKITLILIFLFSISAFSQRNNCDNNAGGQLTVSNSCNFQTWDSNNNSDYWDAAGANGNCNEADFDDAWGWFDATSTSTTIAYQPDSRDAILSLFEGGCNPNGTAVACSDTSGNGGIEVIVYPTTIGTRYRVRIQRYNHNGNMTGDICVYNSYNPCTSITNIVNCGTNVTSTFNSGFGTVAGACTFLADGQENVYTFTPTTTGFYSIEQSSSTGYVDYYYKPVSDGCSNTGWTCTGAEINGAGTDGSFSLTAGTQYYIMVDPEFSTGGSAVFNIACPSYCTPNSTSNSDYIDDFSTTNGTTNITNNNSGYSANGYGDFTSQIVTQIEGDDITIDANLTTFWDMGVGIWVDWDNDLDFDDPGDQIYSSGAYVAGVNFTYTIPTGSAGTYRLRILADLWDSDPDPCSFDSFGPTGEAEDYTLVITPRTCTDDPTDLTAVIDPSLTSATINWTSPATLPASYEWVLSADNDPSPPNISSGTIAGNTTTHTLPGLTANTEYFFFIRSECTLNDFGVWVPLDFDTCDVIETSNATCTPLPGTVIIGEAGTTDPFSSPPPMDIPSVVLDCQSGNVTLEAFHEITTTSDYSVAKIDYFSNTPSFNSFAVVPLNIDDQWASNSTDLSGFDFCFYEQDIDYALMNPNGCVALSDVAFPIDLDDSTPTPGANTGWSYEDPLPQGFNFDNALFDNAIYGVYHDLDPSVTNTELTFAQLDASDPTCRRFIFGWVDVPMYEHNNILYSGAIVLYENSNIIEVYVREKSIDDGPEGLWNDGNAIVGIQGSSTAGEAVVAPCKNTDDNNWTATNKAWRFTPSGTATNPTVEWYAGSVAPANLLTSNPDDTVTVNTSGTYIAVVTTCGGRTYQDQVIVETGGNTWTSAAGTSDWNTAGNWSHNTVPDDSDHVIIPDITTTSGRFPIVLGGAPIPPAVSRAGCLTIQHNGVIEIGNGGRLFVTDGITVEENVPTETDGKLLIRSGGNLVQINEGPVNSNNNNGSIKMQRSVSGVANDSYIYWSSPVEAFDVADVSPGSTNIFEWNPTTSPAIPYGNWVNPTTVDMSQGRGYIIRDIIGTTPEGGTITPPATTVEFIGVPRNGELTTTISRGNHLAGNYPGAGNTMATPLDDNWNLIGNPYPSSISADAFIAANATAISDDNTPSIIGTIWLWRHEQTTSAINDPFYGDYYYNYDGNQYAEYNYTGSNPTGFDGNIASGQGFFVLMEDIPGPTLSTNITFNNSMRYFTISGDFDAYGNNSFFRTANNNTNGIERHRIWVDLIKPNNEASSILIGYIENATNEVDRLYDAYELNRDGTRIYSIIDTQEFSIQGRALPFDQEDRVPLGIVINDNGIHKIAINTLDGLFEGENGQNIYLEDSYTNIIHDLRASPYTFTAEAGTYNDRFTLRYNNNALSVNDFEILNGIKIFEEHENLVIKSQYESIESVEVYDILGRTLFSNKTINSNRLQIESIEPSELTLFLKIKLVNGQQKIEKIIF